MVAKPKTATSFLVIVVLAALFRGSASNADQDRAECGDKLVGITTCLPYVAGETKSPSLDCCTGLKPVIDKSRKCLCLVIKDRDDPSLGLKINLTLALGLPDACHTPMNVVECVGKAHSISDSRSFSPTMAILANPFNFFSGVDLLHLAPNSTEAKAFDGSMAASNATTPANTPSKAPSPTGKSVSPRFIIDCRNDSMVIP